MERVGKQAGLDRWDAVGHAVPMVASSSESSLGDPARDLPAVWRRATILRRCIEPLENRSALSASGRHAACSIWRRRRLPRAVLRRPTR